MEMPEPKPIAVDVITACKQTAGVIIVFQDGHQKMVHELTPDFEALLNQVPKDNIYFIDVKPPGGCMSQV
jgi:hypothetical protein